MPSEKSSHEDWQTYTPINLLLLSSIWPHGSKNTRTISIKSQNWASSNLQRHRIWRSSRATWSRRVSACRNRKERWTSTTRRSNILRKWSASTSIKKSYSRSGFLNFWRKSSNWLEYTSDTWTILLNNSVRKMKRKLHILTPLCPNWSTTSEAANLMQSWCMENSCHWIREWLQRHFLYRSTTHSPHRMGLSK